MSRTSTDNQSIGCGQWDRSDIYRLSWTMANKAIRDGIKRNMEREK